jgi:YHS domain-containing protein
VVLKDPVCGRRIRRDRAHARVEHNRVTYYLCCPRCQAEFEASPERYARPEFGEPRERVSAHEVATLRHPS